MGRLLSADALIARPAAVAVTDGIVSPGSTALAGVGCDAPLKTSPPTGASADEAQKSRGRTGHCYRVRDPLSDEPSFKRGDLAAHFGHADVFALFHGLAQSARDHLSLITVETTRGELLGDG